MFVNFAVSEKATLYVTDNLTTGTSTADNHLLQLKPFTLAMTGIAR